MSSIREQYVVVKRNLLNEMRGAEWTLQEMRFFVIYLSRIDPRNINTRIVRFPLADFQAIMELGRLDIGYMKRVTSGLLRKIVIVNNQDTGGYTGFQVFKRCQVDMDVSGKWYVEIDAHDEALPLMFDYKREFFSYQLWNTLRLGGTNQIRMYEVMKQFERLGSVVISVDGLRELLGIKKEEYPRYGDFRRWVLEVCREAVERNTDIKFSYEPHGARGKGGKIRHLVFYIQKNTNYVDQLTLDQFLEKGVNEEHLLKVENEVEVYDLHDMTQEDITEIHSDVCMPIDKMLLEYLASSCDNEFTTSQMIDIWNAMENELPKEVVQSKEDAYRYLVKLYGYMNARAEVVPIRHRHHYFLSLIGKMREIPTAPRRSQRVFKIGSLNTDETESQRKAKFDRLIE